MALIDFIEESKWMKYKIIVGDETIRIDLNKELVIDEDNISNEVSDHPRIYAFLSRIHKLLVRDCRRADINRKKIRSKQLDKLKQSTSVAAAREQVEGDPIYLKAYHTMVDLEYKRDTIESILESFKQRKDLLQTLSANLRSERN